MKTKSEKLTYGELFRATRKRLGVDQETMADRLDISVRSYQMYENGDNDGKDSAPIQGTVNRLKKIAEALDSFPDQTGNDDSILANIIALRSEMEQIKNQLLLTIQSQARVIESLTKK